MWQHIGSQSSYNKRSECQQYGEQTKARLNYLTVTIKKRALIWCIMPKKMQITVPMLRVLNMY